MLVSLSQFKKWKKRLTLAIFRVKLASKGPCNVSLVDELLAERREEARHE